MLMSMRMITIAHYSITQVMNAFADLFCFYLLAAIEDDIARGKIDLHILHSLFFKVTVNVDGAGAAVHSFHFPLDLFHAANLPNDLRVAVTGTGISWQHGCYSFYFCRMQREFNRNELASVAKDCWNSFGNKAVIALHGEMGSGKTTLVHALCEVKGVKDTVGSPTFSLINEYRFMEDNEPHIIYHMDLYRLKDEEEAMAAGIQDAIDSGNNCFVEWPEKAPGLFPGDTIHLYIEVVDSERRRLRIERN
jgi:tRNA threonylcarbamoyladenosine biosynthesis protein TsaE